MLKVNVYNRWGGLVYHSDNYLNDWGGTYKGSPLPDGTYYYVIEAALPGGLSSTLTGNVTIIR
jgi:gliding motility-associated-like protein